MTQLLEKEDYVRLSTNELINKAVEMIKKKKMITRIKYKKALISIFGSNIPIAKYIGTMRAHDCDKNAWKNRKNYEVYTGYILTKRIVPGFDYVIPHIFNVKNNKVYEFTRLLKEKESVDSVEYFGKAYTGNLKDMWKTIPTPKKIANLAEKF